MARPPKYNYDVDDKIYNAHKLMVESLAAVGASQEAICRRLECNKNTLRKYFSPQLQHGKSDADNDVKASLYRSCLKGNVLAQIFWVKSQCGWVETEHVLENNRPPIVLQFSEVTKFNDDNTTSPIIPEPNSFSQ